MRLKQRLLAFSQRLHARIRKTRYMHKIRCVLINRRRRLLAMRLLWNTPICPSNSRFPRVCAKCLLKLKRLVSFFFSSRRRHTRFDCDWSSDECSSDLAYTPSGGNSFRASGASRFSVGTPIVRPRPAPRTTFPRIPYERPSQRPAASRSPCASAVRISVDEIGCPLSRTASDRKSTRLNSSHSQISYAVFCLKKKNKQDYSYSLCCGCRRI